MRKHIKLLVIILLILIMIILFGVVAYKIDYKRAVEGKKPIFCVHSGGYLDGGKIEYFGLGYKVIAFSTLSGYNEIKFGNWNMQYEDFQYEIDLQDATEYYKKNLENLPKELPVEEAVKKGFFVYDGQNGHNDKIYNLEKLHKFIENTQMNTEHRISDEITIVTYNYDGKAFISNLGYGFTENVGYVLTRDYTRFEYAFEDGWKNENRDIANEYMEITVYNEFPQKDYGITLEDGGFSNRIIYLKSYSDNYEDFEVARYIINTEQ